MKRSWNLWSGNETCAAVTEGGKKRRKGRISVGPTFQNRKRRQRRPLPHVTFLGSKIEKEARPPLLLIHGMSNRRRHKQHSSLCPHPSSLCIGTRDSSKGNARKRADPSGRMKTLPVDALRVWTAKCFFSSPPHPTLQQGNTTRVSVRVLLIVSTSQSVK
jgi:hypothetical protein